MIDVELTFCEGSSMSVFLSTKSSAMERQTTDHTPQTKRGQQYTLCTFVHTHYVCAMPCDIPANTVMIPSAPPFPNRLEERKTRHSKSCTKCQ